MSRELETTERIARGDHARSSYIQSRNSHVASNAAVPSEGGCIGSSHTADEVNTAILTSVVMPCLNEARTLAACIQRARVGCEAALAECGWSVAQATDVQPSYEIIVADNGSSDGSQSIAQEHGAQVVTITQKGYGAALQGGITAAKGRYVVMGDSDCSYDFGEVPRFIERLEQGYDLVMGNRFAGEIKPGAMPWHHRFIGNPVLSGLGRLLYRTPAVIGTAASGPLIAYASTASN